MLRFVENMPLNILFLSTFKKGQMAKPFYFWQTVSKRQNLEDLAFKKAKWQPCVSLIYNSPFPPPSNCGPLHYRIRALLASVLSQTGAGWVGGMAPLRLFHCFWLEGGSRRAGWTHSLAPHIFFAFYAWMYTTYVYVYF